MTSTEEERGGGGGWRFQPFASFRERGYPWLWASSLSYGAAQSAQTFLFVWLVIEKLDRDYPSAVARGVGHPHAAAGSAGRAGGGSWGPAAASHGKPRGRRAGPAAIGHSGRRGCALTGARRGDGSLGERRVGARGARAACPYSRARAQGADPERQCAERRGLRSRGWGRDSPGGGSDRGCGNRERIRDPGSPGGSGGVVPDPASGSPTRAGGGEREAAAEPARGPRPCAATSPRASGSSGGQPASGYCLCCCSLRRSSDHGWRWSWFGIAST